MEYHTAKIEGCYGIKITAEENDRVIGWAILVVIVNERHDEPYGLLENVYVEIEYRGKGVGTKLVNLVIDEARARGCYKIIATSRHSKLEVHALYKKYGFEDHGIEFRMDLIDSKPKQRD